MKTDDLVSMLATGVAPVPRRAATRRLALALAVGLPLSFGLMLVHYGIRRDLVLVMFWPMFWVKVLFPACIAVAGFVMHAGNSTLTQNIGQNITSTRSRRMP
ncbi:MAG: DUF1109 domain-containing protein [Comamonadaceae bacterium]|nr:MAG: DUF1109 domain-containing protein [Comamonadaceae bacterium]